MKKGAFIGLFCLLSVCLCGYSQGSTKVVSPHVQVQETPASLGLKKPFEIKELRFGMTDREMSAALKRYVHFDYAGMTLLPDSFTIAGITPNNTFHSWSAFGTTRYSDSIEQSVKKGGKKARLCTLFANIKPEDADSILERFKTQYGIPMITRNVLTNAYGVKVSSYTATWDTGAAVIMLVKYGTLSQGSILIEDKVYQEQEAQERKEQEKLKQQDF